ncbi:hypothetical protein Tco_0408623 [Tanacetum coccineum]
MEKGFLTTKGRGSGNGVKEKRDSVVDYPDMVHGDVNPNSGTSDMNTLNNLGKSPGNEIVNCEMPSSSISTTPVLFGTPKVLNTGPILYVNIGSAVPTSPNKNGSEQVGNKVVMNECPSSYTYKLNPASLTKANFRKLKANLPNYADYDVWLPLTSVHEVNDRMKNSLYGYFIGKRLASPIVECFVRNNSEKLMILTTNTSYPSRKIWRIRACTHKIPQRKLDQYVVSREDQYAVLEIERHFKTLSLDKLRSPDFNLLSDQEYSEEEVAETMAKTMEHYMSKTRADYGSGVARPKIKDKDNFELKGQFLKELRTNTFSGSDH